jgi:imidazoleglycerol-phosphate dehydratase
VEDSAIALGQAIAQALGDKKGITRYGSTYAPMDEALARVALDISGRPILVWKATFSQPRIGTMDTEMFEHWFQSVSQAAGITLHIECLYGTNNHHIIEGIYKGFARAMAQAIAIDPRKADAIPSTKGMLGG